MTAGKSLEVYYRGRLVGTLAQTPDGRVAFQYAGDWLRDGFSISPLSLPLKGDVFIPPNISRIAFDGLFGIFADSLPDSWGALLLDCYLDSLHIDTGSLSALDRLAYVGRSGMGALEYYPSREADFNIAASGLDYDMLSRECDKLLSSETSDQLDTLYKLGGSSGGTSPKILLSENGTEWIVKFPAKGDAPSAGKTEYEYSLCAKDCGIVMTDTALIPSAYCDGFFKTERFDRHEGQKIFTASFAALLEADYRTPAADYHTLMKLVRSLTKDHTFDKEQLFKVMCFNVAAHNRDDHLKNFSFTYTEDASWRLAPAYDLTYSSTYWGEHTTSVNGKGTGITETDLLQVGTDAGIPGDTCVGYISDIVEKTSSLTVTSS